ncbi:peptide chain release factor 2 (bRF-2) [Heliophilum fasciatum]|uniref:Peptide chain release factor 2 n=1 Tax=Heliophilum fasciatum TaxID=35700 RepID=A0A4R2RNP6_9FIRM|nr:peptide chain release factor 2 [Heliophilum fasciatum]TCP60815.1 peptide chain release factor 2 (bRF-2) [Heliophilum fasciatum]
MTVKEERIAELENTIAEPAFWEDQERAQQVMQQLSALKAKVQAYYDLRAQWDDLHVLRELGAEEADPALLAECEAGIQTIQRELDRWHLDLLLSGKYDRGNAYVTLHAGAGGTEAMDWNEMLMRMYVRWGERRGYTVRVLDSLPGDEAGMKSASLMFVGENAYGYLKGEMGVHRLVRISPFDSSGRRHTSFASVEVMPEVDAAEEVPINAEDLRVDTYRSSGAGGQHVNKTESAIRITHLPTGIVVSCQTERSQIQNRASAMSMLQAKLKELQLRAEEEEKNRLKGTQQDIAFGSQIRSYVFHPYNLVKDHRTSCEVGNVYAVMDGEIDDFVSAHLIWSANRQEGQGQE